jgi:hypothetical protein
MRADDIVGGTWVTDVPRAGLIYAMSSAMARGVSYEFNKKQGNV